MQVGVSLSTSTLIRSAQQSHQRGLEDDKNACIYEDQGYESGAVVVPFSWEEKPGVPLIVNSKYTNSTIIEAIRAQRECELRSLMLSSTIFDHMDIINKISMCESTEEPSLLLTPLKHGAHVLFESDEEKALAFPPLKHSAHVLFGSDEEKALAFPPLKHGVDMLLRKDVEKALAFPPLRHGCDEEKALALIPLDHCTGQMLFPLPPPPKSSLQFLNHNVGAFSASTTTAPDQSNASDPSPPINYRANVQMKKHRASSFPPFLNVNKPTSASNHVGKAYNELIKEDPFLRAIQACTQPSSNVSNHTKECHYNDKKSHNLVGSAKDRSATKNSSSTTEPHSKTYESSDNVQSAMEKDADPSSVKSGFTGNAGDVGIKDDYATMTEKEVSFSSNLHVNGESMKAKVYEGHSAFMVAGFQQQQRAPKQKKPHTKDHRSTSYGGCLDCRSADHCDSIVRIHNPRSSFS